MDPSLVLSLTVFVSFWSLVTCLFPFRQAYVELSGPDARCGRCEFCLTKSRLFKGCELCERTRIYDKRAYHPWGIVGGDGEVEQEFTDEDVKEDPLKFLKLTSVRLYVEQEVPRLVITPPASYDPATCVTSAEKDKGKRKAKPAKLKTEQAERDAQRLGFHKQHGDCVQPSSPRWGPRVTRCT
eukprot:jgi/Mesvir1/2514/Mv01482-RA.1